MHNNRGDNIHEFEQALFDIPEIVQAQSLLGDPDFILHIVTQDMQALSGFIRQTPHQIAAYFRHYFYFDDEKYHSCASAADLEEYKKFMWLFYNKKIGLQ